MCRLEGQRFQATFQNLDCLGHQIKDRIFPTFVCFLGHALSVS